MDANQETSNRRLTIQEASDIYQVHPNTIRRWITGGRLPAYRVGGVIRIKASDLDAMAERIQGASA